MIELSKDKKEFVSLPVIKTLCIKHNVYRLWQRQKLSGPMVYVGHVRNANTEQFILIPRENMSMTRNLHVLMGEMAMTFIKCMK